jgi:hypothetical protein
VNKTALIVILFVVVFLALLGWSTFHGPRYRVRVCMAYAGKNACRTVSGKSEPSALRGGIENACADMVSGVTDTMACAQTPPQSVTWLHRP